MSATVRRIECIGTVHWLRKNISLLQRGNYMSENKDFFIKIPQTLIRIPAFGRLIKDNPALMPVWSTLVSWGYYKDSPYHGNNNHLQSKYWADIVKNGKLPTTIGVKELVKITGFDKRTIQRAIDTLTKVCMIEIQKNLNGDDLFIVGFVEKNVKGKIESFPTFLDSMGRRAMTFSGNWACQSLFESLPENGSRLQPIYDIRHGANEIISLGFDAAMDAKLRSVARPKFGHIESFMDEYWHDSKHGNPHQFNLYFIEKIDKLKDISCDIQDFWEKCSEEFYAEFELHFSEIGRFIIGEPHKWNESGLAENEYPY
ncbi:hypothetical protein [Deinococcus sedimenti]|nr:hypothetical protein [Deinococcus sedimenti]